MDSSHATVMKPHLLFEKVEGPLRSLASLSAPPPPTARKLRPGPRARRGDRAQELAVRGSRGFCELVSQASGNYQLLVGAQ